MQFPPLIYADGVIYFNVYVFYYVLTYDVKFVLSRVVYMATSFPGKAFHVVFYRDKGIIGCQ